MKWNNSNEEAREWSSWHCFLFYKLFHVDNAKNTAAQSRDEGSYEPTLTWQGYSGWYGHEVTVLLKSCPNRVNYAMIPGLLRFWFTRYNLKIQLSFIIFISLLWLLDSWGFFHSCSLDYRWSDQKKETAVIKRICPAVTVSGLQHLFLISWFPETEWTPELRIISLLLSSLLLSKFWWKDPYSSLLGLTRGNSLHEN